MQSDSYNPFWREKFQVRSYDIGLNSVMRMSSMCSYFQEVAGRHANHLDVGYHFMQQSGMVWVLSRLYAEIIKMPAWGQDVFFETWPLGNKMKGSPLPLKGAFQIRIRYVCGRK